MENTVEAVDIRGGRPSDKASLAELLAAHKMETDVDPAGFLVAEKEGRILGAVRPEWISAEETYLRPIVVDSGVQGEGVGRALLEKLFTLCPMINVIARGDAAAFYQRMGFTVKEWVDVLPEYSCECEACEDAAQCGPIAMIWTKNAKNE